MTTRWFYRALLASAALSLAACETPQPQYPTSDNYKAPPPVPAPQPQYPTTAAPAAPADNDHAPSAAPTTGVDTQSLPPAEKSPSAWMTPDGAAANPYLIRASYDVILADASVAARRAKARKVKLAAHAKAEHTAALRGSEARADRDEDEPSPHGARTIKVRRGETLDEVVRETGAAKDDIIEANGLKRPYHLMAGHILKIPHAGGEDEASAEAPRGERARGRAARGEEAREDEAASDESERAAARTPKAYVAKRGDTVYAIARHFKIAPGQIEAANGFGRDVRLHPGQRVLLPRPPGEVEAAEAAAAERREADLRRRSARELAEAAPPTRTTPVIPPAPSSTPPSQGFIRPYPLVGTAPSPNEAPSQPVPYSSMSSSALAAPPQRPQRTPPLQTYTPSVYAQSQSTYARPPASSSSYPATSEPAMPQPYIAPPVRPATPPVEAAPPPTDAQVVQAGRGRFVWPVHGQILSGFGPKVGGERNDGLDIAASEGAPVLAAAAGEVVYAGDQVPGFGNLVLIKHEDGWVTAYAHLSKTEVKIKDRVTQGMEIGLAGQTGGAAQPEVHFEIRYAPTPRDKARPVDPALLLNNP